MAILIFGLANIALCHAFIRRSDAHLPTLGIRIGAVASALTWISALFAGTGGSPLPREERAS